MLDLQIFNNQCFSKTVLKKTGMVLQNIVIPKHNYLCDEDFFISSILPSFKMLCLSFYRGDNANLEGLVSVEEVISLDNSFSDMLSQITQQGVVDFGNVLPVMLLLCTEEKNVQ